MVWFQVGDSLEEKTAAAQGDEGQPEGDEKMEQGTADRSRRQTGKEPIHPHDLLDDRL